MLKALANNSAERRRTQTLGLLSLVPSAMANFVGACRCLCFRYCLMFNFCSSL